MRDITGKPLNNCDYVQDTISGELRVIVHIGDNEVDTLNATSPEETYTTTVGQPSFVQRDCVDFCFYQTQG
jgi:hypothetical protein